MESVGPGLFPLPGGWLDGRRNSKGLFGLKVDSDEE